MLVGWHVHAAQLAVGRPWVSREHPPGRSPSLPALRPAPVQERRLLLMLAGRQYHAAAALMRAALSLAQLGDAR